MNDYILKLRVLRKDLLETYRSWRSYVWKADPNEVVCLIKGGESLNNRDIWKESVKKIGI